MPTAGVSTLTVVPPLLENSKLAWVLALQAAFQSAITDPALKYSPVESQTKLKIYTAYPRRFEFLPFIAVSLGSGDMSFTYLSDDFVDDDLKSSTVAYAGRVVMTVQLTVVSKSTAERERIVDHLIIFVRHILTDILRAHGQTVTRDIRVGPETLVEVENEPAYEQVIDIPVYLEYQAFIDQSTFEYIRKMSVTANAVNVTATP